MEHRISREKLFMSIAHLLAQRSTCNRAQVGAVIVRDHRIISTGYGGSPSGAPHCIDVGCDIGEDGGCTRTVHAEVNAIAFAAKHGIMIEGATLYTTLAPCFNCAKIIVNSGIKKVYFKEAYRDPRGSELLSHCGVSISWFKDEDLD